jgi:predicted AlkP superfamily phosphohydrolase/phosphomutase
VIGLDGYCSNKDIGMKKPAVLVIGLDGATFDLMGPLMEKGKLPHLKSLIESGSSANLLSTMPHHSGPAWASFVTGMGPGKHGVY